MRQIGAQALPAPDKPATLETTTVRDFASVKLPMSTGAFPSLSLDHATWREKVEEKELTQDCRSPESSTTMALILGASR